MNRIEKDLPRVLAMLICENTITDQYSGQRSVIGIYDTITPRGGTPYMLPQLVLYLCLQRGRTEKIDFSIHSPAGEQLYIGSMEVRDWGKNGTAETEIKFPGFPIPSPGAYPIRLSCEGEILQERSLFVEVPPPAGAR